MFTSNARSRRVVGVLVFAPLSVLAGALIGYGREELALLVLGLAMLALVAESEDRSRIAVGMAAAMPIASVAVAGKRVQVFTALALVVVARQAVARKQEALAPLATALFGAMALLAMTAVFGDLVRDRAMGILLMSYCVAALAIARFGATQVARQQLEKAFVFTVAAGCGYALLQVIHVLPGPLVHQDISIIGRPSAWFIEPDWLGLFAAVALVLSLSLPLSTRTRACVAALCASGVVLSFARAAWLALVAAALVAACRRVFRAVASDGGAALTARRRLRAIALPLITVAFVVVVSPTVRNDLARRASTFLPTSSSASSDVSGRARQQQTSTMLSFAASAPWYGHGLSSAGRVGVSGKLDDALHRKNNIGSNWILSFWTDGKLLAVPAIVVLLLIAYKSRTYVEGACLFIILVNSLFSNAFLFPITWLMIGLCLARLRANAIAPPLVVAAQGGT
jgi:hypothetical protein